MAGRIFGPRVFGPRVFGRVFGGLAGTATPEILGWLPHFDDISPRKKQYVAVQPQQTGWAFFAANAALRNGVQQYAYLPPAKLQLGLHKQEWSAQTGWMQTAADVYTASVAGWRAPHGTQGLPLKTTRDVRQTVFDLGWITRATPGTPIPDVAFMAAINPEKGGYPALGKAKNPYLRYEWSAQGGWIWFNNILPLIIAGVAAIQTQRGQEYRTRARPIAPYMQRWNSNEGWIPKSVDVNLSASWAAVASQVIQEYTLRGRERGAYLPSWLPQAGWLYAATQLIVRDTSPAFITQSQQEYTLRGREKLRLSYYEWAGAVGWILHPAFVDLNPIIAAVTSQMALISLLRRFDGGLVLTQPFMPGPVPIEPEPEPESDIRRIIVLASTQGIGR